MENIEVYVEVDNMMYTFADDTAVEAWALHGDQSYLSKRPATIEDQDLAGLISLV